jgi:hypothetical protein
VLFWQQVSPAWWPMFLLLFVFHVPLFFCDFSLCNFCLCLF